ncbi:hypothetical protein AMTRI_Chr04g249910 [Amborella trichopoda]
MIIEISLEIGISQNFWPHLGVSVFQCLNTFEVHSMSSVSTNAGGYQWRTCLRCNLQCKLTTSSSRSNPRRMYYRCTNYTFFQWYDEYMEGMNYNINLKRRMQQFLVFLCVMNAFMFVLLLLKSI